MLAAQTLLAPHPTEVRGSTTGFMSDRHSGVVKWFSAQKGYGFILRDDGSDVFVHFSEIESDGFRTLRQGQSVEYALEDGDKGPHAKHVELK